MIVSKGASWLMVYAIRLKFAMADEAHVPLICKSDNAQYIFEWTIGYLGTRNASV